MAVNASCKPLLMQLSAYVDGELSPKERAQVEQHLGTCKECPVRVADLRAQSGLLRLGMEFHADEVDFRDFSAKVMARITPERPPVWERMRASVSEMFAYQRGPIFAGMAVAALALVAVPVAINSRPAPGYGAAVPSVNSVTTDAEAHVQPVVLKSGNDSIVWLVDHTEQGAVTSSKTDGGTQTKDAGARPKGGEL